MRVVCDSVEDFLANLKKDSGNIYRNIVYFSITNKEESEVKKTVGVQSSAVIDSEEGGQFIVELGLYCGIDYSDHTQDFEGTEAAKSIRTIIANFCNSHDLEVRPGIVDY